MALSTSIPAPSASPPEGHDIQRKIGKIHQHKGGNDGNRNGNAHNGGGADPSQKEEKYKDCQHDSTDQAVAYLSNGRGDVIPLILHNGKGKAGKCLLHFIQGHLSDHPPP